jgi:hypothetical protein
MSMGNYEDSIMLFSLGVEAYFNMRAETLSKYLKLLEFLYMYFTVIHNQNFAIQVTCFSSSTKPLSNLFTHKGYKNGKNYTI